MDDIEAAAPDVRPRDIVFFAFGYGRRFNEPSYPDHPYLGLDVLQWLIDQQVRIVGVDTVSPDLPGGHRPADYQVPIHMGLLGREILIVENLGPRLTELASSRVEVIIAPLPVVGADGAPAVVLARKSNEGDQ
jgi:kynurenine formamidase